MIYYKNFDFYAWRGGDPVPVAVKKKETFVNLPFAFDIETSQTAANGSPVSFMYVWQMGINGAAVYGRTWAEFGDCLKRIRRVYAPNGETIVIYVHNLAYEFAFVAPYLKITDVFARSPHHPIYFRTADHFEFRCSYFLTGKSLAMLGQETHVKKLVGDLDYKLLRHRNTELTPLEMQYCENDVLILNEYIYNEIKRNGDITKIPLTKTGYVRREVLDAFKAWDGFDAYQKKLRCVYPSVDVFALLNKSFSGGFTHANCSYVGLTLENVASVDIASSYPTQMLKHKFPSGRWHKLTDVANVDVLTAMCKQYACIMEITYKNLQAVSDHHTISRHKCSIADNAVVDNGRIVSGEYITTYITSVDFIINQIFYKFDAVQVHQFYYCNYDYLPRPLIGVIIDRYKKKTLLKNADNDNDIQLYKLSKEFINSLYGMTVTNPIDDTIVYNNGEWTTERGDVNALLNRHRASKKYCLPYAVGVFVTAWARYELLTTVAQIGDDAIYCDTDSIKIRNYEKHKHIIEEYNRRNADELKAAMKHHGFAFSDVSPNGKTIGVFEYEFTADEFKTLGAKRYCYTHNGEFSYTVAGLPKSKTAEGKTPLAYMKQLAERRGQTLFDVFEFDMEIPAEYTCKLESVYNITPWRKTVIDYTGKKAGVSEKFGVALSPIPFTMGICSEFWTFLCGGENNLHKPLDGLGTKPDILKINPLD